MTEGASFVRARGVHHVVVVFEIVGRVQKRVTIPTDRRENDRLAALQGGRRLAEQKSDARRLVCLRPFSCGKVVLRRFRIVSRGGAMKSIVVEILESRVDLTRAKRALQ